MSEENKHMDDSFKKMSEELNASYDKSFWNDAKASLENEALDNAFRDAAAGVTSTAGMALAAESLGDAFMDDAFQDAAAQVSVTYSSAYWAALQAVEPDLVMDDAFLDASKAIKPSYNPAYWGAANTALESEGLHYEYNASYWDEAKSLLDNADRRSFYTKWTGAAALLLLVSLLGMYVISADEAISGQRLSNEISQAYNDRIAMLLAVQKDHSDALVQLQVDQTDENDLMNDAHSRENVSNNGDRNNAIAENNGFEPNNTESQIPVEANDVNNEVVLREEQHNGNNDNLEEEVANPNEIEPNPLTPNNNDTELPDQDPANGFDNAYNSLDPDNESNARVLDAEVNNSNQEIRSLEPASKNNDIDKLGLPSGIIAFKGLEFSGTPLAQIEAPKLKNTHTFSLLGGVGKGIGYGAEDYVWTNRIYGGIAYDNRGHGKFRKFGIGGSVLLNICDQEDLRFRSTIIRFLDNGTTESNHLHYNVSRLYYLNANVNVSYSFLPKHKLNFGVGISRVISANSIVSSNFTGKEEDGDFIRISNISNNNNAIPDEITKYDLTLTLGYEFEINRRLSIQITGKYGLFDRTNELINGSDKIVLSYDPVFDNERSVMIGLKYNLFRGTK